MPNLYQFIGIYRNLYQFIAKYTKIYQHISKYIKIYTNISINTLIFHENNEYFMKLQMLCGHILLFQQNWPCPKHISRQIAGNGVSGPI